MFFTIQDIIDLHDRALAAKSPMDPLETMLLIALSAHHGQKRYNGEPYITHPLDVSSKDPWTLIGRIARIGHDVVEETKDKPVDQRWTYDLMRRVSIPEESIEGIIAMTKLPAEEDKYFDFTVRIGQSIYTGKNNWRASKMADIEHNMQSCPPERLAKYRLAFDYLKAIERHEVVPGTAFGTWMASLPEHQQRWDVFAKQSTEELPHGVAGRLTRAFDEGEQSFHRSEQPSENASPPDWSVRESNQAYLSERKDIA